MANGGPGKPGAALLFELLALGAGSEETHRTPCSLPYLGRLAGVVAALIGLLAEESAPHGPVREAMEFHGQ